jgi:carbon-monoxide dehydrogenase medium subunit
MKPPAFHYFDPTTVAEAIALLQHNDNAKILAGGQSLMPMLNMRFVLPDALIDLNRIKDLSYIRRGADTFDIGAMTRQRDVEFSPEIRADCPIVIEAIENVGHRQTRNRGTIGGSLCHLDPAAELVTIASVLDGTVEVTGPEGRRDIQFTAFPAGYMAPAIDMNEIVTGIRLPIWSKTHGHAFIEFSRRHGDFALASVAALIDVDAEGRIARAAVAVGGVASVPLRMSEMEAGLVGQAAGDDLFEKTCRICETIEAVDDAHVPASYRRHLAGVLSFRALRLAAMRARKRRGSGALQ